MHWLSRLRLPSGAATRQCTPGDSSSSSRAAGRDARLPPLCHPNPIPKEAAFPGKQSSATQWSIRRRLAAALCLGCCIRRARPLGRARNLCARRYPLNT
eukprot:5051439-Prymnesium_polylepis.1